MKRCPKCGRWMMIGSPHEDGWAGQYECHGCGYIEMIPRGSMYR
jgi:DNA-directed RNA polymerase subunit M/transcription elongation factor TFIIS